MAIFWMSVGITNLMCSSVLNRSAHRPRSANCKSPADKIFSSIVAFLREAARSQLRLAPCVVTKFPAGTPFVPIRANQQSTILRNRLVHHCQWLILSLPKQKKRLEKIAEVKMSYQTLSQPLIQNLSSDCLIHNEVATCQENSKVSEINPLLTNWIDPRNIDSRLQDIWDVIRSFFIFLCGIAKTLFARFIPELESNGGDGVKIIFSEVLLNNTETKKIFCQQGKCTFCYFCYTAHSGRISLHTTNIGRFLQTLESYLQLIQKLSILWLCSIALAGL